MAAYRAACRHREASFDETRPYEMRTRWSREPWTSFADLTGEPYSIGDSSQRRGETVHVRDSLREAILLPLANSDRL